MNSLLMALYIVASLFSVSVAATAAANDTMAAQYWKSALPHTNIPDIITRLLRPEATGNAITIEHAIPVDSNRNYVGRSPGPPPSQEATGNAITIEHAIPVDSNRNYVGRSPGPPPSQEATGNAITIEHAIPVDSNRNYLGRPPGPPPSQGESPHIDSYFLEEQLLNNMANMRLEFVKSSNPAAFLPRHITESIPFSSAKLPEILARFSVAPGSATAQIMKDAIEDCEIPPEKGAMKSCPGSVEAMVDLIASKLGRDVEALTTQSIIKSGIESYTVTHVEKRTDVGEPVIVCHHTSYVYAVYLCHGSQTLKSFRAMLKAADGSETEALAVCHTRTQAWDPNHAAFKVLKVKPGAATICHFLAEETILWIPVKKYA